HSPPHTLSSVHPTPPPTAIYTLSLHDALPIWPRQARASAAPAATVKTLQHILNQAVTPLLTRRPKSLDIVITRGVNEMSNTIAHNRREFLRLLGASAATAALSQSIERAHAIPAFNRHGSIE